MRRAPADGGSDAETVRALERLLSRAGERPATAEEAALLLSAAAGRCLEALARRALTVTRARFGRAIRMFAPLYLSNACVNVCHYCGFSVDNRIRRRTLSVEEAAAEWRRLRRERFRHVLLVSGEDFREVPVDRLARLVERLRPEVSSLAIEVAPLTEPDYRRLVGAGLDGVVIYQETYDRARYAAVHPRGPKRDYAERLAAIERAAAAGARRLGMGVLLGLSPWREDVLALVRHARAVQRRFWRAEVSVSVPRLRPAAGGYAPPFPVEDRDLAQVVAALRLCLPQAGIVLSTREPAALRDRLVPLGVTEMSAGSRTDPGGYGADGTAEPQFSISDTRAPGEVAARLAQMGYDPVWKDGDAALATPARVGVAL